MNNDKGSSLLSSMLVFLMIAFFGLKILNFKLKTIEDSRYRTNQYLCMKEYNGKTTEYIKFMESINRAIILAKAIEYITWIIPQLRPFVLYARKAGKGISYAQEAYHFSYLKNYIDWSRKSCYFDPRFFKNPYKMSHYGKLKRDNVTNEAIMREKKWSQILYAKDQNFILKSDLEYTGDLKTKIQTQEYAIPKMIKFRTPSFKDIKEAMRQILF